MAKQKTPVPAKKSASAARSRPAGRVKKLTKKQQIAADKKAAKKLPALSGSFSLSTQALRFAWVNRRVMLGITIVYLVLSLVFVHGFQGGVNTQDLKDNLELTLGGNGKHLGSAFDVFGTLLGNPGGASDTQSSLIQTFLLILESLVLIWALRQLMAGKAIRIKQAYYSATDQLVQFILVLFVLLVQCLPLIISSALFQAAGSGSLVLTGIERLFWVLILVLGALWTVRLLSSSIFAMYIVTLDGAEPRSALRAAKKLVRFRRLQVIRRLLFVPLFVTAVLGAVVIPLIVYATFLAEPVFYILSTSALLFVHTYIYQLYRELLL